MGSTVAYGMWRESLRVTLVRPTDSAPVAPALHVPRTKRARHRPDRYSPGRPPLSYPEKPTPEVQYSDDRLLADNTAVHRGQQPSVGRRHQHRPVVGDSRSAPVLLSLLVRRSSRAVVHMVSMNNFTICF